MTMSEYLNDYLNKNNISMREFAKRANMSHTYISYIINGKTGRGSAPVPTIEKYRDIAKAMNMDVNALLAAIDDKIVWGNSKPEINNEDAEAFENYFETDPDYVILASRYLKSDLKLTVEELELIKDYRLASAEIREEAAAMLHRSAERNRKNEK